MLVPMTWFIKREALINTVKTHTKNIAVSSVVKRYDNKVNASDISHYNHLLHELCTKYNIAFIDNDCIDQPFLNQSNLHLNKMEIESPRKCFLHVSKAVQNN